MQLPDIDDTLLLSVKEAGKQYGIPISTLRLRLSRGEILGTKVRGQWRVPVAELEEGGYVSLSTLPPDDESPEQMRETIARLSAKLVQQRRRADKLELRLGEAIEDAARLHAALENRAFNTFADRANQRAGDDDPRGA